MNYDNNNICFYHSKLSREDAEQLLLESNGKNGTFLVRDSKTSAGDFVLSILFNNEVIHYQIRKHEDDAFFSIDEHTISHGLETLIEYYQEASQGLVTPLADPIVKDPPPHDTRRHGRTNLLHRATKEGEVIGNYTVVKELLKCGYRSLEAKNQEGQTAVHLASQLNQMHILDKLINSGANVNCRDSEGNTPLHYACHRNSPITIQKLVVNGGANVQMRNTKTGWVALHESASRGYIDCVKMLLSLNAPLRPRTNLNEIPVDLARINGHSECAGMLAHYKTPPVKTLKSDWYHGTLGRVQAVEILKGLLGTNDGSFLVRYSEHSGYVLTMLYLEQAYNFQIRIQDPYYYIDDGPYLDSLEHVIDHYMTIPDGLPTKLQTPVPPKPSPPLPSTPHPSLSSTLPRSFRRRDGFASSLHDMSKLSIHSSTLPLPAKNKLKKSPQEVVILAETESENMEADAPAHIPSENVILLEVIGKGEFGSVHKGILQNREGFEEEVAIKTLSEDITEANRNEFMREATVMMKLKHECIVRFIGICEKPNLMMIQELISLGSMLNYLINFPQLVSPTYELIIWASQIARGMLYLEEQRFVHRDLAARNILLASKYQAKITDFGLSRTFFNDREYYRATQGGRWPIKWYAPESYNHGVFSTASDVWSFGVTLWEMYSYGDQPYGSLKGSDVIDLIEKGERLHRPSKCPHDTYQIMEQCWAYNARNRPTFLELVKTFVCPEYTNVQELMNGIH